MTKGIFKHFSYKFDLVILESSFQDDSCLTHTDLSMWSIYSES